VYARSTHPLLKRVTQPVAHVTTVAPAAAGSVNCVPQPLQYKTNSGPSTPQFLVDLRDSRRQGANHGRAQRRKDELGAYVPRKGSFLATCDRRTLGRLPPTPAWRRVMSDHMIDKVDAAERSDRRGSTTLALADTHLLHRGGRRHPRRHSPPAARRSSRPDDHTDLDALHVGRPHRRRHAPALITDPA